MNKDILNLISVIKAYQKFILAESKYKKTKIDQYEKTYKYFITLKLPYSLTPDKLTFERILYFPENRLEKLNKIDPQELIKEKIL